MVSFFELLGRGSVLRVLGFFLENPSKSDYAASIARQLGMSKVAVLSALKEMNGAGIIAGKSFGRAVFFSFNASNPLAKQLKIARTVSALSSKLGKLGAIGAEIFLYGSAARGEDVEESDVDLLVLGRDRAIVSKISSALGHDVRVKVNFLTPLEYAALSKKDEAFYESVERDKIRIL